MTAPPKILFLKPNQLIIHPKNMRRFYPADEIREMAQSIVSSGGLLHAMRVTPARDSKKYLVIDGNKRLHAARLLNGSCPPLKCEIVVEREAQQLLDMIISNKMRSDPDPISEGLHYKRLMTEEHYNRQQISQATGVTLSRIDNCVALLDLDEPIQQLVAEGKFPADPRARKAILPIPDKTARIKLAERLAQNGATIRAIIIAANQLSASLKQKQTLSETAPSHVLAQKRSHRAIPSSGKSTWQGVRAGAREMCDACDIKSEALGNEVPEPAWTLISHATQETCDQCNLKKVVGTCSQCPGVEMLTRLLDLSEMKSKSAAAIRGKA